MSISLSTPGNGPIFLTPNDPLIEGAYAAKVGCVVRIGEVCETGIGPRCWVHYVQARSDGDVIGGGSSGTWGREAISAITDPRDVLIAFADHARRMKAQAEQDAVNADKLYASAKLALNAMKLAAEIAANPSTPKE